MAYTISDVAEHKLVNGELVKLTEEERQAVLLRWNAPDTRAYDQKRQEEYPSIGDQLDMLWHAMDVGDWNIKLIKTTSFYTELKAVKDANPKP